MDGEVLRIARAVAKEGLKGTVEATGEVLFDGLLPDDLSLDIKADRFLFASYLHLRALLRTDDLRMTLRSPVENLPRRPHFQGTLEVIKARYTGEFSEGGGDTGGIGATTNPSWTANFRLQAPRTARIQNRAADLLLDGDVDLVRDASGMRIYGIVEIPQGRVPIFNNDFDIVRGTLDYSRARGLDPSVEIEAETRVQDFRYREGTNTELERVTVYLTGTFSDMHTRFESESGYDEETIVRVLAGFSEDPSQNALADTGFKAGLNFIERSIAQEIGGIDTLDIETESASLSEAERTRVAVGKYLSPDLYLRYSQGLSISERELFLEYQMTRQLRLSSELGTRLQGGGAETTFNVDLKYRVEY
jgi:translocation and assembly module TamB